MAKAITVEGSKLIGGKILHNPNQWALYANNAIQLYKDKHKGKETMPLSTYFGWRTHKGQDVFVLGNDVYGDTGIIGHAYTNTSENDLKILAGFLTSTARDEQEEKAQFHEARVLMNKCMQDESIHFGSKLQVAASLMSPLIWYAANYCPEAGFGGVFLHTWG